jgi:hypothetical protein
MSGDCVSGQRVFSNIAPFHSHQNISEDEGGWVKRSSRMNTLMIVFE